MATVSDVGAVVEGGEDSFVSQESEYQSSMVHSPMQTSSFKVDEGYSEETRSQPGSDVVALSPATRPPAGFNAGGNTIALPPWVLSMNDHERQELAYAILKTLRTPSVAAIVERLHPLLHLDPIEYLPPELSLQILSYLDAQTLLETCQVSRAWKGRALDSKLWKLLYQAEGWQYDSREVRKLEEVLQQPGAWDGAVGRKVRRTRSGVDGELSPQSNKRRIQSHDLHSRNEEDTREWNPQYGSIETEQSAMPKTPVEGQDAEMRDAFSPNAHTSQSEQLFGGSSGSSTNHTDVGNKPLRKIAFGTRQPDPQKQGLTVQTSNTSWKLNWLHLYKQRKRLEDNWSHGRYVNFQLPHPDHPEEGHGECVYTIQYTGNYLVSGSRDKTVRIWDLRTRRLVGKPLIGHEGSVLCLQFDANPEDDLIVSGSSDTDVIVWKFSTGARIKKLPRAHKESVLNLRFDKRHLVTCSKDKTINVWNRDEMLVLEKPLHARTPGLKYTFDMSAQDVLVAEARLATGSRIRKLNAWSHLATLRGHNAAVNAIQLADDQIVSASGDRNIKVWDLHSGQCLRTIPGHDKGIACVQYDGRRIVSGSSDNTVKIFDSATGAEVACLLGHQFLVRTVQAGFGDLPGSVEEEMAEARAIDSEYFKARSSGLVDDEEECNPRARTVRNAGSRDPRSITAYGASLPPGGGGGRWARIVSGSYDETIIVWKRDVEGRWIVGHRLRQEAAARAASGATSHAQAANVTPHANGQHPTAGHQFPHQPMHLHQALTHLPGEHGANGNEGMGMWHPDQVHGQPLPPQMSFTQNSPSLEPGSAMANFQAQQHAQMQTQQLLAQQNMPHQHHHLSIVEPDQQALIAQNQASQQSPGNSRVFKLQFDARRIICCSQNPRIVGWDFANDDEEIIEASRFFTGLE